MLSDSSLTNIFLVSGVSQIRYRVYCQSCKRSKLADFLKCEAASEAAGRMASDDARSKREPDLVENTLIKAFRDLLQQNIPCFWHKPSMHGQQKAGNPPHDDDQQLVQLELWVFWFDERHTGLIDDNEYLKQLEEIKIGSFTWESAVSRGLSPTSSPGRPLAQTNAPAASVTVSKEYKLFIKSVRNIIRRANICKGAIPLGEYFIFESNSLQYNTDRYGLPAKSVNSMVACTYNVYLTNGSMVFQPEVRRIALRPLTFQDMQTEKEVIVCPSGQRVTMSPSKHDLPEQMEEEILGDWSKLLEIPRERLQKSTRNSPRTICIRSRQGNNILYPSSLIFVPSNSSLLSATGYGDIFGYAHGTTEDLGQLWRRWAWTEKVSEMMKTNEPPSFSTYDKSGQNNEARLNFWGYESPRLTTVNSVLENLSHNDPSSTYALLSKALAESVSTSPLMFSKAVATPASSGTKMESITDEMMDNMSEKRKPDRLQQQSQLSLVEFARLHFPGEKTDEQIVTPNAAYPVTSGTSMDIVGDDNVSRGKEQSQDNIMQGSFAVPNVPNSGLNALNTASQNSTLPVYQSSPGAGANEAFDLGLEMGALESSDNMVYGMSNDWGDMADLDNLDINITEEDFDFFKSEPAKQPEMFVDPTANNASAGFNQPEPMHVDDANIATLMHMETMPVQEIGNSAMSVENETLDLDSFFANSGQLLDNPLLVNGSNTFQDTKVIAAPTSSSQTGIDTDQIDVGQGTGLTPAKMEITPGADEESISTPRYSEIRGENSFVPPDFAPVKFSESVNDSKYSDGGKFMFLPSTIEKPESQNKRQKRDIYRPDYMPRLRKRLKTKEADSGAQRNGDLKNASSDISYAPKNAFGQDLDNAGSDTSSSDDESSSESDSSYSADDKEKQEPEDWMHAVQSAQADFAEHLLDKSKPPPFRACSADGDLDAKTAWQNQSDHKPLREESQEDSKVLEYFCQQVVMGGYPFTSGLASIFADGGVISEGETTRGVCSRYTCVSHIFNDDVMYFSSSPNDYDQVSLEFKNILGEVFERKLEESGATEQGTGLKQPAFPGSVVVKGPLTIQQYYDLSETNQAHSKYGKYQVKKRRPAEPNFDILSPPDVVVSRSDEYIEGSPKMVAFWEKLRLEPYSARKNISYFVVYPTNEHLEGACAQFFKALSSTYETCLLGSHHPGNIGPYRRGLVPVPLLPASPNETWTERQIRSYMAECQNLGSALSAAMAEKMNIVIYIVDPTDRQSSSLDLSRCFHKLMISYHAATVGISMRAAQENRMRLAMQLVPIEHILRPSAFGGYTKFGLKEIAFSVYSKCHAVVGRDHGQMGVEDTRSIAATYTPPFVLAKPIPAKIKYTLSKPLMPFPTIMDQNATLHVSYSFSLDRRWLVLVWTDNEGEFMEFSVIHVKGKPLSLLFEDAWSRTLQISRKAALPWSFVIAKNGLLFEQELQAWTDVISNDKKVAIVSVDLQSSFHIQEWADNQQQQQQYMSSNVDYPQTPGSSVNTPTPENFGTPTNATISTVSTPTMRAVDAGATAVSTETLSASDTRALVLNHRVAYSSKKTHLEHDDESWILPLASGYLIQPAPTMNPITREQFTSTPTITEIHLVHNQTSHSAYSTLRDIIKRFHALSYVNTMPSNANSLPIHLVVTERLTRTLLLVHA